MTTTEFELCNWRQGNVAAERLSAALLHLEGFTSVDPQCPLGGPDGGKDLLCQKNDWKYVAAVYFPTTLKEFKSIKEKFENDLNGVGKNNASGIVFITNQKLTPGERSGLEKIAAAKNHNCIIYNVERILGILNSPVGYGVRLQYLRIAMSTEEQLSFFSRWDNQLSDKLRENRLLIIEEISRKIDSLVYPVASIHDEMNNLSECSIRTASIAINVATESNKSKLHLPDREYMTATLSVAILCTLHRAVMLYASRDATLKTGILRGQDVWLGKGHVTKEESTFVPSYPEDIRADLECLCGWWNDQFAALLSSDKAHKIRALAKFHHEFLYIHPFLDGNGRLARFLLMQQASDLLGVARRVVMDDQRPYFDALRKANEGDCSALEKEITQSLFGSEFIVDSAC